MRKGKPVTLIIKIWRMAFTPNLSHYPFVVLKADNSVSFEKCVKRPLAVVHQVTPISPSTMIEGGSVEQQQELSKPRSRPEYLGVCLLVTQALREFTKKFSLYK
ncbi:DUF2000 family protein [Vibrio lentus]|nr:DUF2000 family protein [Vibrio lentus]